jgi:hypothetical protein
MTEQFAVFISNIAQFRSPQAILHSICREASTGSFDPIFREAKHGEAAKLRGLRLVLSNKDEYECVYYQNGSYVFNQQIWIIKFPSRRLGECHSVLTDIFFSRVKNGVADLSGLKKLVAKEGGDQEVVNFQNLDFVEFLLFTLGVESGDERFTVEHLLLRENQIHNINGWDRFFFFLPALRYLDVRSAQIRLGKLSLPGWPWVVIDS